MSETKKSVGKKDNLKKGWYNCTVVATGEKAVYYSATIEAVGDKVLKADSYIENYFSPTMKK